MESESEKNLNAEYFRAWMGIEELKSIAAGIINAPIDDDRQPRQEDVDRMKEFADEIEKLAK